jgi:hypothetical protein
MIREHKFVVVEAVVEFFAVRSVVQSRRVEFCAEPRSAG